MQAYLKESWKTDSEGPNQGKADVRCCPVRASLLTVITIALFFSGREEKTRKNIAYFNIFAIIIIAIIFIGPKSDHWECLSLTN